MRVIPIGTAAVPLLDPDILWNGVFGDLAVTAPDDPANPAGLRGSQALATAVLICLMTDCRADASELRPDDINRGWPGDAFDLETGETPLGSKLWLLRRRALTAEIELLAADYGRAAVQPLVDQGAFARIDVAASVDRVASRMEILVSGYGRDGEKTFEQRYGVLWDQIDGVSAPLA